MKGEARGAVVSRLPVYLRGLNDLREKGVEYVNSGELGAYLGMTSAQVRKDLSCLGTFGTRGKGYNVTTLRDELRRILGLNRKWRMALIGVGRLGRAILDYEGFVREGFPIVAAFDKDPSWIGKKVGDVRVQDMADIAETLRKKRIDIAIVAVPASEAQEVIDWLIQSGIGAILNYAPVCAQVPADVQLQAIDPVVSLQTMTFYLVRR